VGYFEPPNRCTSVVAVAIACARPSARQPRIDRHMQLTFAAALAVVAALAEFTIVPYIQVGGAALQPVLVFGAIWAVVGSLEAGLVWAFVGGLALDVLSARPLGASAFSLLIAIGIAFLIGTTLRRVRILAPIVATAVASLVYSMLLLYVTSFLNGGGLPEGAASGVFPSAIYSSLVAVLVGPLAVAVVMRRRDQERTDW
jgi:rod shape-determining protein MreD